MNSIKKRITARLLLSLCFFPLFGTTWINADSFELQDGDRVVLLGSEFVEQQIKHNFLESALTLRWPERRIQFRNLGWAGDTPTGIARGYFGGANEGFRRLMEELDRVQPTVIFVCYGANSASDEFSREFEKLFSELEKRAQRIVVLSHPSAEDLRLTGVDVTETNQIRQSAANVLRTFVENRNSPDIRFVDLFARTQELFADQAKVSSPSTNASNDVPAMTTDTIRYTEAGYQAIAQLVLDSLGMSDVKARTEMTGRRAELRQLISEKNQLYFHRYRPQNETYLRGFRKHEQGQNAKEISEFDSLIEQAESRIFAFVNDQPMPQAIAEPSPIELAFDALPPEQQRKLFTLPEELDISLFAAEPLIANPIHMNFDSAGRLWVATSPIYPQIKPGAKPRDEIVVLEDTDGDGRADTRTVFADDLLIPTAVLPDERGGAYVANSTELIHLADTDGDGRADSRRVVLAGFGTEDTHHIIHTFRWGPDTALFFNQSIYIHSHLETPHGVRRLMGSGIWRFEPESIRANVLMRGLVNPWGHIFDDWGQSFATDGAGGDGINFAFPGSAYPTAVGFRQVLRGMNPGQPKHCGLEIISGRHFPEAWRGTLVTNDFRGNRINRFELSELGSGYSSKQLPDLLSSSHRAFRPVDVKMAPDGSLMVADWYNPIINHGEVDFRDARRDYKHGRIWRVTVKDRPPVQNPSFATATVAELVAQLRAPEQWNRVKARIELKSRDRAEVEREVRQQLVGSASEQDHLEALWTMESVEAKSIELIRKCLSADNHRVRAATIRVLANQPKTTPEMQAAVLLGANDPHPRVRLEFIHAWRRVCHPSSIEMLLQVMNQPIDQNIEFALTHAIKDTQQNWIENYVNSEIQGAEDLTKLLFVFRKSESARTVPRLLQLIKQDFGPEQLEEIIRLIGEKGNAKQLGDLFDLTLAKATPADPVAPEANAANEKQARIMRQALDALLNAAVQRKVIAPIDAAQLLRLENEPVALHLTGLVCHASKQENSGAAQDRLRQVLEQEGITNLQLKVGALRGLAAMQEFESLEVVARSSQAIELKREVVDQLISAKPVLAAQVAAGILVDIRSESETAQAGRIADIFLTRKGGAERLIAALDRQPLSEEVIKELLTRARTKGAEGKLLAAAVSRVTPAMNKVTKADIAKITALVETQGDPVRGEAIYRRDNLNCIKCHAIAGAGGVVGPDMISLGASSPVDYIVQSLIDPSAKIKEGYHTTTVITTDGQQISGKMMSQADGKLTLRDADNQEHVFNEDDIEAQKIGTISLMPDDLTSNLNQSEFVDLASFLSSLGKDGPFKVSSDRLVRRWILPDGKIVFSRVDGTLPLSEFKPRIVSCEIEVTVAGAIGMHVENPAGLRITRNESQDNLRAEKIVSDLPVGIHRFHFQIPGKNRESLRVKLFEVEGSAGKAVRIN